MSFVRAALFVILLLAPWPSNALADAPGDRVQETLGALTECAGAIVRDDRGTAEGALARASTAARAARALMNDADAQDSLGRGRRTTRRKTERLIARTDAVAELLAADGAPRLDLVRALKRAARDANRLRRRLARRAEPCPALLVRPARGSALRRGGGTVRLRAVPADDGEFPAAALLVAETLPAGAGVLAGPLERTAAGRYRVRLGDAPGAVRIEATACSGTASLWIVVTGSNESLATPLSQLAAPGPPRYADTSPSLRVGESAALAAPSIGGGAAIAFTVAPALPAGLRFDDATGAISGTPLVAQQAADYVVTATNAAGAAQTTLSIEVTPALPPGIDELAAGFVAAPYLSALSVPVKMAFAPDGRLFFNELGTGNVRVVSAAGELRATPFHSLAVLTLGEQGLLGIALAPDFATSGHVFVYASVPAADGHADRNQVLRLTASGDVGTAPTVIVDDLPIGTLRNAGDLAFGPDGNLYVSIGDTTVPALAQTDGSRAGRILRYTPDGSVPADNPIPGDPEWCRGLRNPFGLAFHTRTGGLFVSENGPTANDKLLFAQPEKNFEWGPVPPGLPVFLRGFTLTSWTPVIVPTGITFVSPDAFGSEFADDLFLCGYDLAEVRRIRLSGELLTDIDEQAPFLLFADGEAIANKPLDITEGPDGALYVSTFSAIWRVRRFAR